MRWGAAVLAVAITMVLGSVPVSLAEAEEHTASTAAAPSQSTERVCRDRVSLRHAPAGVRIGYLERGDRVIVVLYARRHRWAYVISEQGYGWLLTRALCRR